MRMDRSYPPPIADGCDDTARRVVPGATRVGELVRRHARRWIRPWNARRRDGLRRNDELIEPHVLGRARSDVGIEPRHVGRERHVVVAGVACRRYGARTVVTGEREIADL